MAGEIQSNERSSSEIKPIESKKPFIDHVTLWVGIIGSLITILLTVWNAQTKALIDRREQDLKSLEIQLKARATGIEESKERINRYKWVLSLFSDLNDKDERKRNFTVSITRLVLTKEEAEQLFTGLQTSHSKELQSVGQSGIEVIQNEPIALLVSQMNADTAEVRKKAVDVLERKYKSSSQAITLALRTYDPDRIDTLSPNGLINGLYFLKATDPTEWNQRQLEIANKVISSLEKRGVGLQTRKALNDFKVMLQKVPARQ